MVSLRIFLHSDTDVKIGSDAAQIKQRGDFILRKSDWRAVLLMSAALARLPVMSGIGTLLGHNQPLCGARLGISGEASFRHLKRGS